MTRAASGILRWSGAAPTIRTGARNVRTIHRPSTIPLPQNAIRRQLSYYDTKTGEFTLIDTCYGTHHLQFANDDTLWLSGDSQVVGWLDTKKFDQTKDERASQGWCPTVLDTNGDGKITRPWNEPGAATDDPAKDTRIASFNYGIIANAKDGSIWVARPGPMPGALVRLELGKNPPETCKAEIYQPPFQTRRGSKQVGLRPARHRHRRRRDPVDGARRQRPHRQLRSHACAV